MKALGSANLLPRKQASFGDVLRLRDDGRPFCLFFDWVGPTPNRLVVEENVVTISELVRSSSSAAIDFLASPLRMTWPIS